jgi:FixJ family two-component response regulator
LIEPLNVRELQILRLIEEGMVNKDVSATLAIGLDTVEMASQERVQEARRCDPDRRDSRRAFRRRPWNHGAEAAACERIDQETLFSGQMGE